LKSQTPNPKLQKSSKSQATKNVILNSGSSAFAVAQTDPASKHRSLELGAWDFPGVWCLAFGAFLP
jgi:hypothetical protein